MLTNKDYCDYDTSIALSELGFPLKRMKVKNFIDGQFSDSIVTVLLYEAQKWLREEKGIELTITPEWDYFTHRKGIYYIVEITYWKGDKIGYITDTLIDAEDIEDETAARYKTYEEALSEGIKEAVKILKENYE